MNRLFPSLRRIASLAALCLTVLAVLLTAVWGAPALWYRLPFSEPIRTAGAGLWALAALATLSGLFLKAWRRSIFGRYTAFAVYAVGFSLLLLWWSTILPSNDLDWTPDVARIVSPTIEGDKVTLANVRDFDWRSDEDFTVRWETRRYDLSKLRSVDFFASYWAGPAIAHTIISFGFEDGRHVAFSFEIRKQRGQSYSEIAGFFKEYHLALIAADERDIIKVRTNVRGEDVQLYPLDISQEQMRALFLAYVEAARELDREPRFYNTITSNCTTLIFHLGRIVAPGLPFNWRVLLSGYVPDYLYAIGLIDQTRSLQAVREGAHIAAKAKAAPKDADFSAAIRAGTGGLPLSAR